jgi:hypothetical protein
MTQITKVAKAVVNIGASLYMLKEMGFFDKPNKMRFVKTYATNYYEVVDVIVNSNMLDSTKEELIEIVENFRAPSYYKAIANIVNGNMLESTKIEMIKTMSLK